MMLSLLVPAALASVVTQHPYSHGWTQSEMPIATGASVSFTVVVNEQGVQEINQLAAAVSDPANENYGQWHHLDLFLLALHFSLLCFCFRCPGSLGARWERQLVRGKRWGS
jgi:hypothetical protein